MRIRTKGEKGESRELLLKEYYLNAYLIALLKQAGRGGKERAEDFGKAEPAARN